MKELINKTHRQIFCYNKDIGHLFVPNLNARIINEKGGYYVRTNSLGFRSNFEFKKKKGNYLLGGGNFFSIKKTGIYFF